jgi:hypothetical protein
LHAIKMVIIDTKQTEETAVKDYEIIITPWDKYMN